MRVVIVHYHLKPGGVTTVIRRHLDACSRKGVRAFLLVGEEPAESPDVPYAVLPELAYDAPGPRIDGDAAREREHLRLAGEMERRQRDGVFEYVVAG